MKAGRLNEEVTFQQVRSDGLTWMDLFTRRAYINGVSGNEFFIANAGYEAALTVTITLRYDPVLLGVVPQTCRAVDHNGIIYELLSPADDKEMRHKEIIFRARRIYSDVQ